MALAAHGAVYQFPFIFPVQHIFFYRLVRKNFKQLVEDRGRFYLSAFFIGGSTAYVKFLRRFRQISVDTYPFLHLSDCIHLAEFYALLTEKLLLLTSEKSRFRLFPRQYAFICSYNYKGFYLSAAAALHGAHNKSVLGRRQDADIHL